MHQLDNYLAELESFWDRFYIHKILALRKWLYWFLFLIISYLAGESSIYFFKEKHYTVTLISLVLLLSVSGAFYSYVKREYIQSFTKARKLFINLKTDRDFSAYLIEEGQRAFTFIYPRSKIPTWTVIILGFLTLFYIIRENGFPFNSIWLNAISFLFLLSIFGLCGHGTYTLYRLAVVLIELSRTIHDEKPRIILPDPGLTSMRHFYVFVTVYVFIAYAAFMFAILYNPYGLENILKGWMVIFSIYPFGFIFLWTTSFYRINEAIKSVLLTDLNEEILNNLLLIKKKDKKDCLCIDRTNQLLKIQSSLASKESWPFSAYSLSWLILSLLPIIIQIYYVAIKAE